MAVIFIIILILFLVLVAWMWHSLGSIEKRIKIPYIIIGLVIVYVITFIIYNISKIGINYEDKVVMQQIRNVFVILFTIVNGYVILPYVFRKLEQVNNDEVKKQKFVRSIMLLMIIVTVIFVFESVYLGNIQRGVLDMMNRNSIIHSTYNK